MQDHRNSNAAAGKPWLMESVAGGAVLLSAGLAAVGVAGIVGVASPLAIAGTGVLIAGTLLTEIAASRLPVHAEARASEGNRAKAGMVGLGFLALTGWNVTAGHMGMVAINDAGVADKRAPIERLALEAEAARITAEEALAAFDARTERQAEVMASGLRGAFEGGYITSGTRALNSASSEREAQRAPLAQEVASTRAADRQAQAQLSAAPTGRPDYELWLFAGILELLKGALVWFAAASANGKRGGGRMLRADMSVGEMRALIMARVMKLRAELSAEDLAEVGSLGGTLQGVARHETARRKRGALTPAVRMSCAGLA